MLLPEPLAPLVDVCTTVYNNTLYAYSATYFQSLALEPGAKWQQLPKGEPVTGGVCVGSTPKNAKQAGLYVVGGKGTNADFKGLQKYTYSTGKWENIAISAPVTQDRVWHGAVYLNASDSILMYAGAQDGVRHMSSQTFTIQASPPHGILSYESSAPPTVNPILLPWSESEAVLIGGGGNNKKVMLFSPEAKWFDSGSSLAAPLPKDITAVKAAIVKGDDGSQNLYTFDMTVSPNEVNRTVLLDGSRRPVPNSVAISSRRGESAANSRRQTGPGSTTLDKWPEYNSTFVSMATRGNFAVAEDVDGLVVIAGGSTEDPLCMFDGRSNKWHNATQRLAAQEFSTFSTTDISSSTSTLTTTSPTTSDTSSATNTPVAPATNSQALPSNAILGIVLGSIAAVAFLLAIIYILLRRRKNHQNFVEAGHNRRASGFASNEKGGIGYASNTRPKTSDRGTHFRGHQPQGSGNSFSSMAILMGRGNDQNQQTIARNNSKESRRTSSSSMFNQAYKNAMAEQAPRNAPAGADAPLAFRVSEDKEMLVAGSSAGQPRPRNQRSVVPRDGSLRRSSGWNRYWSGGSALNMLGFGNSNARNTVASDQSSRYSGDNSNQNYRATQDSATVPPLQVHSADRAPPQPRPNFNRVNSGSPTMTGFNNARSRESYQAQIVDRSGSRDSSHSGYSSGIPASVHEAWDPTSAKPWGTDRAPSSAYNHGGFSTAPMGMSSGTQGQQSGVPSGISRQPQLAMATTSSDMSWLNLGETSNGRRL